MVIAIMILLFAINWLSVRYATVWFVGLLGDGIVVKVAEAVLRTGIIVVIGLTIIYFTKISKEINEIINKVCHFDRL